MTTSALATLKFATTILSMFAGLTAAGLARAQGVDPGDFSLDGISRMEVPSRFHAADLIDKTGGNIHIAHGRLGMPDEPVATDSDLAAFSSGKDKLAPFGPRFFVSLEYSVSRGSLGAGRVVTREVTPPNGNGNAGDKFRLYRLFSGRVVGPWMDQDAEDIGLTPLPSPDESEIDGLSWPPGTRQPVYFSVNLDTARKQGLDPAAIYYVQDPSLSPTFTVYASSAQLGLLPGDDIDALAINDGGLGGTFEPADIIYVSFSVGDPTQRLYFPPGAGDGIIQLSPIVQPAAIVGPAGPLPGAIILGPAQLDLATTPREDNLDAITAFDPGPCWSERDPPPKDQEAAMELRPWCEPYIEDIARK